MSNKFRKKPVYIRPADGVEVPVVLQDDVVDNLSTNDGTKPLSAKQGKLLNDTKVDKVSGKQLSTEDYTTAEKNKLAGIQAGAEVNVQSDWNETDPNSDAYIKNKPKTLADLGVTDVYNKTEVDDKLSTKVDKVAGKGLSTEDYTTAEKNKLAGIQAGAEVNVQSDWNETNPNSDAYIKNKPTSLPADGGNADTVDGKHASEFIWTSKSSQTITGDLTISGNLTVSGSTYKTIAESLYTKKDLIITRESASGGLANNEYTGLVAYKYDGTNYGGLIYDKDGVARVGDITFDTATNKILDATSAQPLATRAEAGSMINGAPVVWDSSNLRLKTSNISISHITSLSDELASKLNRAEYTASDVLNKIKTVDGSGSGLDADLLDGKDSSAFVQIDDGNALIPQGASGTSSLEFRRGTAGDTNTDWQFYLSTNNLKLRYKYNSSSWNDLIEMDGTSSTKFVDIKSQLRESGQRVYSPNNKPTAADLNVVPADRKVNGKALSSDIVLSASDVNAVPTIRKINGKELSADITLSSSDVDAVPITRKVNNKPLSSDITLSASDVGAVPTNRTINGKELSSNIALSASDVGAVPTSRKINNKELTSDIEITASDITSGLLNHSLIPKATTLEATEGISDVKFMTPLRTKDAILALANTAPSVKIKVIGATSSSGRWIKIARIQTYNPVNTSEKAIFSTMIFFKGDYKQAATSQSMVFFMSGIRYGSAAATSVDIKPIFVKFGENPASLCIYKESDGWHYLYAYQRSYSEGLIFQYQQNGCTEYWTVVSSPSGTLIWDSSSTSSTSTNFQNAYIGNSSNIVLHSKHIRYGTFSSEKDANNAIVYFDGSYPSGVIPQVVAVGSQAENPGDFTNGIAITTVSSSYFRYTNRTQGQTWRYIAVAVY